MSGYFAPNRRPRPVRTAAHRGTRADFAARVRAEAAAASAAGGPAEKEFLSAAARYVSDPRTLYAAAEHVRTMGGPARGADGVGPADLDRPAVRALVPALSRAVAGGVYTPGKVRVVDVPKPGGGTRPIGVPPVADRVLERALVDVVGPYADPRLSPTAFGGRPSRSVVAALAALAAHVEVRGTAVVVTADVAKAFDEVDHDVLLGAIGEWFGDTRLTRLVERVVRGRGTNGVGLTQGGAFSPLLLLMLLAARVAGPWRVRHPDNPLFEYIDDLLVPCRTVAEGEALLASLRELVETAKLRLKWLSGVADPAAPRPKGAAAVTDLRTAVVEWLGFLLGIGRDGRLAARIADSSFSQLEDHLEAAHGDDTPGVRARHTALGWIGAQGPAYQAEDRGAVVDRLLRLLAEKDFPGVVTGEELLAAWGQAYARYEAALTRAREELGHTAARDAAATHRLGDRASPARTTASIVPASGEIPAPSTRFVCSPLVALPHSGRGRDVRKLSGAGWASLDEVMPPHHSPDRFRGLGLLKPLGSTWRFTHRLTGCRGPP